MLYDTIVAKICDQFGLEPDQIHENTTFIEDLGVDSLDVVELVIEMENEYGLPEVPEEDLKKLVCVRDLVDYVSAHATL